MIIICVGVPLIILFYLICLAITGIIYKNKEPKYKFIFFAFTEFYIIALIRVVIMPIFIPNRFAKKEFLDNVGKSVIYKIQTIPFRTIYYNLNPFTISGVIQIVGNLVLLMPAAFLIVWIIQVENKYLSYGWGAIISVFIETAQLIINVSTGYPSHAVDIDDLILNSLGYLVAAIIFISVRRHNNDVYQKVRSKFV